MPLVYEIVRGWTSARSEPPPVSDPDSEIRGGPGLQNFFFGPFGLKIRGGGGRAPQAPPLDTPLAPYKNLLNAPTNLPGL